jgi:hypothetical protein
LKRVRKTSLNPKPSNQDGAMKISLVVVF